MLVCIKPTFEGLSGSPATWQVKGCILRKGGEQVWAEGKLEEAAATVQVGSTPQDQRIVGYIACTHLHAPQEDSAIRCGQLDLLQDWLADFRKSTSSSSAANPEELVAFDVVCGDFNFDNCSSDDKLEQQHSLFTHYRDPCRLGPGEEKPWAIGELELGLGLRLGLGEAGGDWDPQRLPSKTTRTCPQDLTAGEGPHSAAPD
ncbi:hypothetical protein P7K49_036624 [Saguinus oedipus]|uniref:sphingomyelin phosphodiesterase n=1 Tax=Saguinus oedipus TaxID=9490 RepID=A0ABQ9TKM9_SAGOE|nr:hypothetical protein P7K49_036624 [Saguinus oedipus]